MTLALQLAAAAAAQPVDDTINPDRPGLADGSNVVGAGRVQVETGLRQDDRSGKGTRFRTLLRAGLTDKVEFRVESNTYTRVTQTDPTPGEGQIRGRGARRSGPEGPLHRRRRIATTLGQSNCSRLPAVRQQQLQDDPRHRRLQARCGLDFLPEWSLNPNVGYGVYEREARRLYTAGLFAATLSYNHSKSLNFFVTTGVHGPETPHGRAAVLVDVGMAWLIGRDLQFDFSAGSRVEGETPPRPFRAADIS